MANAEDLPIKLRSVQSYMLALAIFVVGGVLMFGGVAAVQVSSLIKRRTFDRNTALCVAFGVDNYVRTKNELPPHALHDDTGQATHSWRAMVIPSMAPLPSLYRWDEPWDGPFNIRLAHGLDVHIDAPPLDESGKPCVKSLGPCEGPIDYACLFRTQTEAPEHDFHSHFFAIVGNETAWPRDRAMKLEDIGDGAENTILLAESHTLSAYWSEPVDLEFDNMTFVVNDPVGPGISSATDPCPIVIFADWAVYHLDPATPPETVRALLTANGGEKKSRAELIRDNLLW